MAQANANVINKEERRVYNIDKNVYVALKQEVIVVVEETYLYAKNQRYMWLYGVSSKILVDNLMEKSGKTHALDLEACRKVLAEPIEVDLLI